MTEPIELDRGVYDFSDEEYFAPQLAHSTLSSTGVKDLLPPSTPARFFWNRRFNRGPRKTFDLGHAAHQLVLGKGPKLIKITGTGADGPNAWKNKYDKDKVARARAVGAVPLRPADWDTVHGMADALRAHPLAPKLFTQGEPEKTLIWQDPTTAVFCRAKADWLRRDGIVDYKTCDKADDDSLIKAVWTYRYYIQAAFYLRGFIWAPEKCPDQMPFFAFVAQEKEPPYLVNVVQLADDYLAYGDRKCAEALDLYAACEKAGDWPGYPIPTDEITTIGAPIWARLEEW